MMSKIIAVAKKNVFIEIITKAIFRLFFSVLNIFDIFSGCIRKNIFIRKENTMSKYYQIHKGERCFIICTGPSLTTADLELLKDEYTFGMNSIVKLYENIKFRPTYYGIQDHLVYEKLESEINKYYTSESNVFVADRIKRKFLLGSRWNVYKLNVAYNSYDRWFEEVFHCKFSSDVASCVYSGFSITYSLIQIAAYMGFREIYLIGADCDFTSSCNLHVVEHGVVDKTLNSAKARNLAGYEEAKKFADEHNLVIYNATRGGKLDLFERKNLEEIIRN